MKKNIVILVIPVILLLLLLSYGVLIPWLGFYDNDWLILLSARYLVSNSMLDIAGEINRYPGNFQNYITGLLGNRPIVWQICSLMLQWSSIVLYWFFLKLIWPQRTRFVTSAALIFTVYPFFTHQAFSVQSGFIWLSLCFFMISLVCTVLGSQRPKYIVPISFIGVIAQVIAFASLPAIIIMELIRPLVLWLTFDWNMKRNARLSLGIKKWLPYLVVSITFLVFQLSSLDKPFNNTGDLLQNLQVILRSVVDLFFSSWYQAIEPVSVTLMDRFFLLSIFISILAGVTTWVLLKRNADLSDGQFVDRNEYLSVIWLGLGFLALSILFIYTSTNNLQGYPNNDLSKIVGMYSAGLLIALVIEQIISNDARKIVLVSVLVGIGVGYQIRVANDYRWNWVEQTRLYWQMSWRMPDILPETIFLTDTENFDNEILASAAALNFIYQRETNKPDYWMIDLSGLLEPDQRIKKENIVSPVVQNPDRGFIVITNDTSRGHCLWVLSSTDAEKSEISKLIREATTISDLSRIQTTTGNVHRSFQAIFGNEPEPTWCTYFQKAELARQSGEWETIVQLGKQLQKSQFEPNSVQEWLPFLEAYIRIGDWNQAEKLSKIIYQANPGNKTWLCSFFTKINFDQNVAEDNYYALEQLKLDHHCDDSQ